MFFDKKNLGIWKVLFQASCAWKKYFKKEKCVSSSKFIFHKLSTVTVSKVSHLPLAQSFQSVLSVTTANRNMISCWPWSVLIQSTLFMKKLSGCCWHWEQNKTHYSSYLQRSYWQSLHCISSQDYIVTENHHTNTKIGKNGF